MFYIIILTPDAVWCWLPRIFLFDFVQTVIQLHLQINLMQSLFEFWKKWQMWEKHCRNLRILDFLAIPAIRIWWTFTKNFPNAIFKIEDYSPVDVEFTIWGKIVVDDKRYVLNINTTSPHIGRNQNTAEVWKLLNLQNININAREMAAKMLGIACF